MSEGTTAGQSLPLTVAAAIDRACDRFDAAWGSGGRPHIEEYLPCVEEAGRSHLFRELLAAELLQRAERGERAEADEYRARFPDLTTVVDEMIALARGHALTAALPEKFGRYRIIKPLGRGGMGAVYLAHDIQLDRCVALKVPHFDAGAGLAARERFYREARAAATLDHPNLCPVYDVGQIDGVDYLTMPYLEGKPLSEVIDPKKPGVPHQVAAVIRKLALALDMAHRRGVVHRDLKPANIMVNRSRELVIMDFGLARLEDSTDARLTRTGYVMGTPAYMPPEQAAGDLGAVGPRSDIYSLGVIMYELLTGRRPFEGPPAKVLGLIMVADPPTPTSLRPDLDPRIEAICMKAMAREPEARYASMAELAADLGGYLTRPASPRTAEPERAVAALSAGSKLPASGEDTLAARFFSGLVTEDESDFTIRPLRTSGEFRRPPRWVAMTAVAAVPVLVLLGIILYVATDKGKVRIELDDPNAVVKVDGDEIRIEGTGDAISLRTGEHNLIVKYSDGTIESQKCSIHRGDNKTVRFEYLPKAVTGAAVSRPVPWESPAFQRWMKDVAAMPAEKQGEAVSKKLMELNPGFDGKMTDSEGKPPIIEYGTVTRLSLVADNVTDISPVRALTGLYSLGCSGSGPGKGQLSDLSPLKGLPLGSLVVAQTKVTDLSALNGMRLSFFSCDSTLVSDISPLREMPLGYVHFTQTKVADLSPLSGSGMSLRRVSFSETPVSDVSPLAGMKLTQLLFTPKNITRGIDVVRNMKTIEKFATRWGEEFPPEEFWKKYDAGEFGKPTSKPRAFLTPGFDQWVKEVAAMPAEKQVEAVSKKLMELNPGFDGKISNPGDESRPPVVQDGNVVELQIVTDEVADLSPIRALSELRQLQCISKQKKGRRLDLSPLNGMGIRRLICAVENLDFSTVKGMPLTDLACHGGGVTNLTPISGMPLRTLTLAGNWEVTSLEPLRRMPLTSLAFDNTQVADLSPLRGMPLTLLMCHVTRVADLSPLKGMPLEELYCDRTLITDLSPLAGMKLKKFSFTPNPELKGLQVIRQMNSLVEIGTAYDKVISSNKFWKQYDEGAFSSPRDFK